MADARARPHAQVGPPRQLPRTLRKELLALANACGEPHPALVPLDRIELLDPGFVRRGAREVFGYHEGWGLPSPAERAEIEALMRRPARA